MNRLGVSNIYELLDESDGGAESGKKVQAALEQHKKASDVTVTAAKPAAKPTTTATSTQKQGEKKTERPAGEKGRQDRPRGDRADRKPRNTESPKAEDEEGRVDRRRTANKTGGSFERRGPRVEGEGRPNKRLYDRKSGTGRGPKENKKGGAGKGNWGTVGDEQAAVVEEGVKVETEEVKKEGEETVTSEEPAQTAEKPTTQQEPEEEEEKVRTLDEYLNEKKSKNAVAALPEARKAGEGVDTKQWAKFVPIKQDEESLFSVESKQKKEKAAKEAAAKKSVPADQVIKFQKEAPKRGGQFKKGPRPQRQQGQQSTPVLSDEQSFPALSPKA